MKTTLQYCKLKYYQAGKTVKDKKNSDLFNAAEERREELTNSLIGGVKGRVESSWACFSSFLTSP